MRVTSRRLVAALTAGALGLGLLPALTAPTGAATTAPYTEWLSKDTGTGGRELPTMSADGRYVAFAGRSEVSAGIWLRDRLAGTTTRLTSGMHFNPDISGDGRYIAYVVYGDARPIMLYDRVTKTSEVVSLADDGSEAQNLSDFPSVSFDGRYVAFQSMDKQLDDQAVAGQSGGGPNKAYVRDRVAKTTEMVSVTNDNVIINGQGIKPDITPDGRYVAFASDASILADVAAAVEEEEEEEATVQHIYVRDRTAKTTTMASVSSDEVAGDVGSALVYGPSISADGRYVAFDSDATNLVAGDTNEDTDAFLRDRTAGTTIRLSVDAAGNEVDLEPIVVEEEPVEATDVQAMAPPDGGGGGGGGGDEVGDLTPNVGAGPVVSSDGTVVAFESEAALSADDVNGDETTDPPTRVKDIYLRDVATLTLERPSAAMPGGTEASGTRTDGSTGETVNSSNGADATINADGRYVAFTSMGDLTADPTRIEEEEEGDAVTAAAVTSWEPAAFARTRNVPTVTGISPTELPRARQVTVTVTGTNFTAPAVPGDLLVGFGPGITVLSVTWVSATQLKVDVEVSPTAALDAFAITVTNPGGDNAELTAAAAKVLGITVTRRGTGYRFAATDGGVFTFGDSAFYGSMGGTKLNKPVVGMADTPSGDGYWLVASDGGMFTFGDAGFYGSTGSMVLNKPIVGMTPTKSGKGYWLVASDGGIFSFGDAAFYGSTGAMTLNKPIVGMASTLSGKGYWLVASDGGIFAFGDAPYYGSTGAMTLNKPIVGMARNATGLGYWLVATDGGIFTFGQAPYLGSTGAMTLNKPIVGMASNPGADGYWLVATDGGIFTFGEADFHGSTGDLKLNAPIVGMSAD
jgi:hypothetical protein